MLLFLGFGHTAAKVTEYQSFGSGMTGVQEVDGIVGQKAEVELLKRKVSILEFLLKLELILVTANHARCHDLFPELSPSYSPPPHLLWVYSIVFS